MATIKEIYETKHYLARANERVNVKNRKEAVNRAVQAYLGGKRASDFGSKFERNYLASRSHDSVVAIAYGGLC